MPIYAFRNARTNEVREVMIPLSDLSKGYTDGSSDVWNREYVAPAIQTDTCNRYGN